MRLNMLHLNSSATSLNRWINFCKKILEKNQQPRLLKPNHCFRLWVMWKIIDLVLPLIVLIGWIHIILFMFFVQQILVYKFVWCFLL